MDCLAPVPDVRHLLAAVLLLAVLCTSGALRARTQVATEAPSVIWTFDSLDRIGGRRPIVVGQPRVVQTPIGAAVEFDGEDDALFVPGHPLAGATVFTWEAIFRPDGGHRAQRWFHLQEAGTPTRLLFEIRVVDDRWFLDSYAFSRSGERALMNRSALHAVGRWYHVAAVYDGTTFSNYVDGVPQGEARVALTPQQEGWTAIGVRINLVDWFKGAIHAARFTRRALRPDQFMRVPTSSGQRRDPVGAALHLLTRSRPSRP